MKTEFLFWVNYPFKKPGGDTSTDTSKNKTHTDKQCFCFFNRLRPEINDIHVHFSHELQC